MSETRITLNGLRHYKCFGVNRPLASVTSILSATQSPESKSKIAHWNVLHPGEADKAAERGTWIHNAIENHLKGITVNPPATLYNYWKDVPERLKEVLDGAKILWSEKPFNKPEWSRYVGEDGVGRIHYYDPSTDHGYAGCCDIIYIDKNGETVLGDFKTSTGPYSRNFPNSKATIDPAIKRAIISGVYKLKKTQLQLAAYKLAAESCLGIKIDKTQIFVSTPLIDMPNFSTQVFTFSPKEIEKHEAQWLQVVKQFYDQLENP